MSNDQQATSQYPKTKASAKPEMTVNKNVTFRPIDSPRSACTVVTSVANAAHNVPVLDARHEVHLELEITYCGRRRELVRPEHLDSNLVAAVDCVVQNPTADTQARARTHAEHTRRAHANEDWENTAREMRASRAK